MEVTQETPQEFVVEQKSLLMRILPIAIGGAGLLLVLSTMKEYGVQSWYRGTYILGAVFAMLGLLFALMIPERYKISFHRKANRVTVSAKKGVRLLNYQHYPLSSVKSIRIEQRQIKRKAEQGKDVYRLSMQIMDDWIPLIPKFQPDLVQHEQVAKRLQAFLAQEDAAA